MLNHLHNAGQLHNIIGLNVKGLVREHEIDKDGNIITKLSNVKVGDIIPKEYSLYVLLLKDNCRLLLIILEGDGSVHLHILRITTNIQNFLISFIPIVSL